MGEEESFSSVIVLFNFFGGEVFRMRVFLLLYICIYGRLERWQGDWELINPAHSGISSSLLSSSLQ